MTNIDDLKNDYIIAENEYLRLRQLSAEDSAHFLGVLKAVSPIPGIYDLEGFNDLMWQETVSSDTTLTLAIEWKNEKAEPDTYIYIGECMIKNPVPDTLELGLDIAPVYQNRGLGTGAMHLLITVLRNRCPDLKLVAKIYSDNSKSRHICLKLGGVKTGEKPAEYAEAIAIASTLSGKAVGTGTAEKNPSGKGMPTDLSDSVADLIGDRHIDIFEFRE